jgi:hypothetical protein
MPVRQFIERVDANGKTTLLKIITVPLEYSSYARYKFRCYVEDYILNVERVTDRSPLGFHYKANNGDVVRLI